MSQLQQIEVRQEVQLLSITVEIDCTGADEKSRPTTASLGIWGWYETDEKELIPDGGLLKGEFSVPGGMNYILLRGPFLYYRYSAPSPIVVSTRYVFVLRDDNDAQ